MYDVRSVLHVMFAHHDKFSAKRENVIRTKGSRLPAIRTSEQPHNQGNNQNENIPTVEIF